VSGFDISNRLVSKIVTWFIDLWNDRATGTMKRSAAAAHFRNSIICRTH